MWNRNYRKHYWNRKFCFCIYTNNVNKSYQILLHELVIMHSQVATGLQALSNYRKISHTLAITHSQNVQASVVNLFYQNVSPQLVNMHSIIAMDSQKSHSSTQVLLLVHSHSSKWTTSASMVHPTRSTSQIKTSTVQVSSKIACIHHKYILVVDNTTQ